MTQTLTDVRRTATLAENAEQAVPERIDGDVTFTSSNGQFRGTITVSGLVAGDVVGVANIGSGAGQIGVSGNAIFYQGTQIGFMTGGQGSQLNINIFSAIPSAAAEALIEALTFTTGDNPGTTRTLVISLADPTQPALGLADVTPSFLPTGPASGLGGDASTHIGFGDYDHDGDDDAVVYSGGQLSLMRHDSAGFTFVSSIGSAAPGSTPRLVDFDNDGDLDVVVAGTGGAIAAFRNTGGSFALLSSDNPFAGIVNAANASVAFADVDHDGDMDMVMGVSTGPLRTFLNTAGSFAEVTGAANPFNAIVAQGGRLQPAFADLDHDGDAELVVQDASTQRLLVFRDTGSGWVRDYKLESGFGPLSVSAPGDLAFGDLDSDGAVDMVANSSINGLMFLHNATPHGVAVTINVTAQADATLTGIDPLVLTTSTRGQPHLIDGDVTFGHTFTGVAGSQLTVTGVLPTDFVSINSAGDGPGQFRLAGSSLLYQGQSIANVSGGNGNTLTVAFFNNVPAATIEHLIENLTYQDGSQNPVKHDLTINFTDPSGDLGIAPGAAPTFTEANTLAAMGTGPIALADLDGDGDLDVLRIAGGPQVYLNQGGGAYTQASAVGNPFSGIAFTANSRPVFGDVDGDGDMDLVIGEQGSIRVAINTGGTFTEVTGAANPFNGVTVNGIATPAFIDVDRDGDSDLVIGSNAFNLRVFRHDAAGFTELAGGANPFAANDGLGQQRPAAIDVDGDGDLDLVTVSGSNVRVWLNTLGGFVAASADRNPFAGIAPNNVLSVAAGDVNGDGRADLVLAGQSVRTFVDTTPHGVPVHISFNSAGDAPGLTGLTTHIALNEDDANYGRLLDASVTVTPPPGGFATGTMLTIGGLLPEDSLSLQQGGAVAIQGSTLLYDGQSVAHVAFNGNGSLTAVIFNISNIATPIATVIQAVIQSLFYADNSSTPTASHNLTFNITDSFGHDLGPTPGVATLTELTGTNNPFSTAGATQSWPIALGDLDGDGDLDALAGNNGVSSQALINVNGSFGAPATIEGNPFKGIGPASTGSGIGVGDLDGDGKADFVFGGTALRVFHNLGDGFTELTGGANPFAAFSFGGNGIRPVLADVDGDGDTDLVVTAGSAPTRVFRNDGGSFTELTGAANPFAGVAQLNAGGSAVIAFRDMDGNGTLDLLVGDQGSGNLYWSSNIGGTFQAAQFLATLGDMRSLAVGDLNGDGQSELVVGTSSGTRVFGLSTPHGVNVGITIKPEIERPHLDGLGPNISLTIKPLHPAAQLLDGDVHYVDNSGAAPGQLSINGLLPEDVVGVATGNGFAVAGSTLNYNGVPIGLVTAGAGLFSVRFQPNATPAMIDQLIQNLTYTNSSLSPTADRALNITITDANGLGLAMVGGTPGYDVSSGFITLNTPNQPISSGDVDGDGLADIIVGTSTGFQVFHNNGGGSFSDVGDTIGVLGTQFARVAIADIDHDGDMDRLLASADGTLRLFENRGADGFVERIGGGNPFAGMTIAGASPTFGDIDGDGDMDIVVGTAANGLRTFVQGSNGSFTELIGAANPFGAITGIPNARPVLIDYNNDGVLDLYIGTPGNARLYSYTPGGWVASGSPGNLANAALLDRDGDGDVDIIGAQGGAVVTQIYTAAGVGHVDFNLHLNVQWNLPPSGTDKTVQGLEDHAVTLAMADFGFSDPDGDGMLGVTIVSLPGSGTLTLDGVQLMAGQSIGVADIIAGRLVYTPGADATGNDSLTFQVLDDGGTAHGGVDTDPNAHTLTLAIAAVNDAPSGSDNSVATQEDNGYTFATGDFGFSPGAGETDQLLAVEITTLPGQGSLTLDGVAVTAGQFVSAADIDAGKLVFVPGHDFNGDVSLTFQVQDDGGTANGGVDLDPTPNTITIQVSAVDDAPVAVADGVTVMANAASAIDVVANDSDVDAGPKLVAAIDGHPVSAGDRVTLASGAIVTLNADGTLGYDPNHQFDWLVSPATAAATGASNGSATDSFSYALNGGSAATVTVTVNGADEPGDQLRGSGGDDMMTGTGQPDMFRLEQGGHDRVAGGDGNDGFYFGAAFDPQDAVDGGAGAMDQLGLQGDYAGLHLGPDSMTDIEMLVLLSGSDTRFGDTAGNHYSYDITTDDGNVGAGKVLTVQANALGAGENLTFDGSAETDGAFAIYGGLGTDHLTGGQQDDTFYFGKDGRFGASDTVDGQGGSDQLRIQGDYSGANGIVLGVDQVKSVDLILLASAQDTRFGAAAGLSYSYDLKTDDTTVAAGETMTIQAKRLLATESLHFDGSAETDGAFKVYSGAGQDVIVGGAGADTVVAGAGNDRVTGGGGADNLFGNEGSDTFIYLDASDSTVAARDHILDFGGGDTIDVSATGLNDFIGSGAFSHHAGEVRATFVGSFWQIEGDTDGDGNADLSILVTASSSYAWSESDFVLAPSGNRAAAPMVMNRMLVDDRATMPVSDLQHDVKDGAAIGSGDIGHAGALPGLVSLAELHIL